VGDNIVELLRIVYAAEHERSGDFLRRRAEKPAKRGRIPGNPRFLHRVRVDASFSGARLAPDDPDQRGTERGRGVLIAVAAAASGVIQPSAGCRVAGCRGQCRRQRKQGTNQRQNRQMPSSAQFQAKGTARSATLLEHDTNRSIVSLVLRVPKVQHGLTQINPKMRDRAIVLLKLAWGGQSICS
jgi:hypothetical protein